MKKIASICIVGLLVLTGFGAVAFSNVNTDGEDVILMTETFTKSFNEPVTVEEENFVLVTLDEGGYLADSCKPLIPRYGETYTYPYGTTIESINVDIQTRTMSLPAKIQPAPTPISLSSTSDETNGCGCGGPLEIDEEIYQSTELYPSEQYSIKKDIGLYNGELSVIVNVQCYAQYIPAEDILYVPEKISITVNYKEPSQTLAPEASLYDLLIITDETFKDDFQRLVNHKNSLGVRTVLETTQEIFENYEGKKLEYGDDTSRDFADEVEILKYRMFDAWKDWGIKYVLLGGGRKGQTHDWWVPSRRVYCDDDSDHEMGFESQTYFMDILEYNQYGFPVFSDWDPNKNGVYGESSEFWEPSQWDTIAMYPDIVVGRLPFRYSWEPALAIDKIINYETYTSPDDSWFKHAVVTAGDTSPEARYPGIALPGLPEGIYNVEYAAGLLENDGFTVTRVFTVPVGDWDCDVQLTGPEDLTNVVNPGAGFLFTSGHSSPLAWGDHGLDSNQYFPGITLFTIRRYINGIKLPVCAFSGCSTARFNVTSQDILEDIIEEGTIDNNELPYQMPLDFTSYMVLHPNGGSIVAVGYTGLGYGYLNCYDCYNLGLSQFQNTRLFYYYVQHASKMGEIYGNLYSQVITDCINQVGEYQEDINKDVVDRKHVQEWAYIGDPSLKIGGYGLAAYNEETTDTEDEISNALTSDEVPVWNVGNSFTYKLENLDFVFHEVEGRDFDIHLNSGQIKLTVDEVTADEYITSIQTSDVDISIDIDFDTLIEGEAPIKMSLELEDIAITGNVIFEKETLGFKTFDLKLALDLDTAMLMDMINIELPSIIVQLIKSIPLDISLKIDFDPAFRYLDFPVYVGKPYPLYATTISISGTVESIYLRLAKILDNILSIIGIDIIPDSIAKYLPVIDIAEFMADNGIPTTIEVAQMNKFYRLEPFNIYTQKQISVDAGTYSCYQVDVLGGLAELYYSPQAKMLVKAVGYLGDFIPYLDNINLELVSTN